MLYIYCKIHSKEYKIVVTNTNEGYLYRCITCYVTITHLYNDFVCRGTNQSK